MPSKIIPLGKEHYIHEALHLIILESLPSLKVAFLPSLLDIGPVVLEKKLKCEKFNTDRRKGSLGLSAQVSFKKINRYIGLVHNIHM